MLLMRGAALWISVMEMYNRSLFDLCECFQGRLPKQADWMSLLDLANRTLTTPALVDFTLEFRHQIPAEVGRYIQEMYDRNLLRNARLVEQLRESVIALNDGESRRYCSRDLPCSRRRLEHIGVRN